MTSTNLREVRMDAQHCYCPESKYNVHALVELGLRFVILYPFAFCQRRPIHNVNLVQPF